MTVPHDEPHMKGDAEATEEATLPLDGGNIYVRQDGPATPRTAAPLLAFTATYAAQADRTTR